MAASSGQCSTQNAKANAHANGAKNESAPIAAVWPTARAFGHPPKNASYLTLMMATGLTFGTISSLYGLNHGYIDRAQYTALVTVVILTAIVPTIIAQVLFHPAEHVEPELTGVP